MANAGDHSGPLHYDLSPVQVGAVLYARASPSSHRSPRHRQRRVQPAQGTAQFCDIELLCNKSPLNCPPTAQGPRGSVEILMRNKMSPGNRVLYRWGTGSISRESAVVSVMFGDWTLKIAGQNH